MNKPASTASVSPVRKAFAVLNFIVALIIASVLSAKTTAMLGACLGFGSYAVLTAIWQRTQPACFANNFGALNDTPILHDFFVEFWGDLAVMNNFYLDVQDPVDGSRAVKPGDVIRIKNWKQDYTVYSVGSSGYNTNTDVAPATVTFTIPSTIKAVSAAITLAEYNLLASGRTRGADFDAFKRKVQNGMLFSLAKAMVNAMFAPIVIADYTNYTTIASGAFTRAKETAIEKKFFDRKVPLENPQAILPSDTYKEWVDDHQAIVNYTGEQIQKPLLMSGTKASTVTPFQFSRTHVALPTDCDRGFFATRTAIIGAIRVPDEATFERDPVSLAEIVNPHNGAAVQARLWKNAQTGAIQMDFASIYSFQKGQVEALECLRSADPS